MKSSVSLGHPKQVLLFFIDQDTDSEMAETVIAFVEQLGSTREWVIGKPTVINTIEQIGNSAVDFPIVTLGGYIELYSAYPETPLPKDIDLRHLEEVEYLVEKLRDFSQNFSLEIAFELDGDPVGSIENGRPDEWLEEGFIGEWRRYLEGTA